MDRQDATPRRPDDGDGASRNRAWLVWTISVAVYVALMFGTLVLTEGFPP